LTLLDHQSSPTHQSQFKHLFSTSQLSQWVGKALIDSLIDCRELTSIDCLDQKKREQEIEEQKPIKIIQNPSKSSRN
jgi:hypothetical protein